MAIEDRPVHEPIDSNTFTLMSDEQTVVGEPQIVFAGPDDTFSDLANEYYIPELRESVKKSYEKFIGNKLRR